MALGAGAATMRWGIMAQTADVTTLALIEPLHGLTFALFHLGYIHHCGYCPEQPRRFGAGVLCDRRNWRCNGPVDHTFRLRTCRILGMTLLCAYEAAETSWRLVVSDNGVEPRKTNWIRISHGQDWARSSSRHWPSSLTLVWKL